MRHTLAIITAMGAAALACAPAGAETVFSVAPLSVTAAPGDLGDTFDVVLTNNGPGSISIAGFAFEVSVTDPDISLTDADFSTVAYPYIFANDSFDEDNSIALNLDSGQTLDAADDYDLIPSGVTLTPGESLALGEVQFDVAVGAATGMFAVSLTGGSADNALSDGSGNAISVDTLNGGDITIEAAASTPEPASWLLFAGGLAALVLLRVSCGGPFGARQDDAEGC